MSAKKLKKQLIRDLKASPKKAAALGLLTLVAVYYWAPLIAREGKEPATPEADAASADSTQQSATPPTTETAPRRKYSWREVLAGMQADPRMSQPAGDDFVHRVFTSPAPATVEAEPVPEIAAEAAPAGPVVVEATPQSLGLVLSGTLIGAQRRVAMINGRPYSEGSEIRLEAGVAFTLVQIAPRQVTLARENQSYELMMERQAGAGVFDVRESN